MVVFCTVQVNVTSDRYDSTLKLLPYYVQVRSDGGERLIADDWVIIYAGGMPAAPSSPGSAGSTTAMPASSIRSVK